MALNIEAAMAVRGETISSLAKKMKISYPGMYKHIKGDTSPSVAVLERIAEILDCDVVELFDEPEVRRLRPAPTMREISCPHCHKIFGMPI